MKSKMGLIFLFFFCIACAKLSVETKDPLKVDINMRVDVYQHVVKDVESINDQIYGPEGQSKNFHFLPIIQNVYAAGDSSDVQSAIERRKERLDKINEYLSKGYIGENREALLEVLEEEGLTPGLKKSIKKLIDEENDDRNIIYRATAQKNGIELPEARKIFYKDDYNRASSGYWFEVYSDGKFIWEKK